MGGTAAVGATPLIGSPGGWTGPVGGTESRVASRRDLSVSLPPSVTRQAGAGHGTPVQTWHGRPRGAVWECTQCEARGRDAGAIWHVSTCTDDSEARPLTFVMPDGVGLPSFGAGARL